VEQGIAIDARIKTTTAADFHCDLETPMFSVSILPGFDHLRSRLPASSWAIRSNIVSPLDRRDQPVSALLSLHFGSHGNTLRALYFFFRVAWEFGAA